MSLLFQYVPTLDRWTVSVSLVTDLLSRLLQCHWNRDWGALPLANCWIWSWVTTTSLGFLKKSVSTCWVCDPVTCGAASLLWNDSKILNSSKVKKRLWTNPFYPYDKNKTLEVGRWERANQLWDRESLTREHEHVFGETAKRHTKIQRSPNKISNLGTLGKQVIHNLTEFRSTQTGRRHGGSWSTWQHPIT